MDRNEQFRKRLENKLNPTPPKVSLTRKDSFDAKPYVDIIMTKLLAQGEDRVVPFVDNLNENPDLDFIIGRSSVLTLPQKRKIVEELKQRLFEIRDFDPEPFAQQLVEIFDSYDFENFEIEERKAERQKTIDLFFDKHNFTDTQNKIIAERFAEIQQERIANKQKTLWIPALISLVFILVPPFFIPKALQSMGWLSADAGWLSKIGIGLVSAAVLYLVVQKLFDIITDYLLKNKKLNG